MVPLLLLILIVVILFDMLARIFGKQPIDNLEHLDELDELELITNELSGIHEALDKLVLISLSQQSDTQNVDTLPKQEESKAEYNYDYLVK